jgi:hypothetical protein
MEVNIVSNLVDKLPFEENVQEEIKSTSGVSIKFLEDYLGDAVSKLITLQNAVIGMMDNMIADLHNSLDGGLE